MISFLLNDQLIQTEQPEGMVMLDFVRYHQHLKGTKIGCREGDCGACTVLVGSRQDGTLRYQSMTSCLMPLSNANGKHIVTIEGLNQLHRLNPIQQAFANEGATQCGFCTVGFVVSLMGFCVDHTDKTYENGIAAIDGNICRCTGYKSIERAIEQIVNQLQSIYKTNSLASLVEAGYLPSYFKEIPQRLEQLAASTSPAVPLTKGLNIGGGTDLMVQRPLMVKYTPLKPLYDTSALRFIRQEGRYLYLGATTTAEDMRSSSLLQAIFPNLKAHLKLVSSTPIRNMATLAGNFVNASPIGDLTVFFLALDSTLVLSNGVARREVQLKDFYLGYKTLDKREDELVESLYFEVPALNVTTPSKAGYFNFEKVCKRTHLDIASVNSALLVHVQGGLITQAYLSAGGVAPIPKLLSETSAFLVGKPFQRATLDEASTIAQNEISPISDARGTATYKRLLLRQLLLAHAQKFNLL
ncbi:MAG: FAD binding domain-containing protein [Spirosomataceae bacterium]